MTGIGGGKGGCAVAADPGVGMKGIGGGGGIDEEESIVVESQGDFGGGGGGTEIFVFGGGGMTTRVRDSVVPDTFGRSAEGVEGMEATEAAAKDAFE